MSGHSKWKQIKNKKAAADSKKGVLFTHAGRNITLAAREGGDPELNFKLKMAIEQARGVNMPKENIERAIARGTGEGSEARLEEAVYEGYGPGGVAVIVTAVTDNPNRTVSDVRNTFTKRGGSMATGGSVLWNFEQKGVIRIETAGDREKIELAAIDAGADDMREEEGGITVITQIKNVQQLKEVLEKTGVDVAYAGLQFVPKTTVALSLEDSVKLDTLTDALGELDDVDDCYTNAA